MKRRDLLAMASATLVARSAPSLAQARLAVVGVLSSRTQAQAARLVAAIRDGLQAQGLAEGRNYKFEFRFADGDYDRLPGLAAELVAARVDVILAGGTPGPAIKATRSIPVVFTTGYDPVAAGYVGNINQGDANVTGATFYSGALSAKRIALLREIYPAAARFGLLVKDGTTGAASQTVDMREAVKAAGADVEIVTVRSEDDFEPAFAGLARAPGSALLVSVDPYFDARSKTLVGLAAKYRLPACYYLRGFVQDGGLMSYGASILDTYRQAAGYVGRILGGARPVDLPILLPTRFELALNLVAARALSLTPGGALIAAADEIVD